eukprot:PhF_6_TR32543/c0_g1_i1/m.48179
MEEMRRCFTSVSGNLLLSCERTRISKPYHSVPSSCRSWSALTEPQLANGESVSFRLESTDCQHTLLGLASQDIPLDTPMSWENSNVYMLELNPVGGFRLWSDTAMLFGAPFGSTVQNVSNVGSVIRLERNDEGVGVTVDGVYCGVAFRVANHTPLFPCVTLFEA